MKVIYILCAMTVGFVAKAQTESEMALSAEQQIHEGDTIACIEGYILLLKKYPQSLPATVRLMELYESTGEFDVAIQYANISLDMIDYNIQQLGYTPENNKDLAAVYYLKGKIRMKQSNYSAAIELLQRSIDKNPNFGEGYSELARAYFEMDRPTEAMGVLKEGIKKAETWRINYNLGILYTNTKHYDSAKICFQRSLQLNPKMVRPHYFLGSWYFGEENFKQALFHYELYLAKYPDNKEVVYNSATSYMNVELYFEAISMWTRFLKLEPSNVEAFRNRGLAYMYISEFQPAIDDFNTSISIKPSHNYAYVNRGSCYFIQDDFSRAISDFDVIIKDFPKYGYGYYYRALSYKSKGRRKKSCSDLKQALTLGIAESAMEEGLIRYCTMSIDN